MDAGKVFKYLTYFMSAVFFFGGLFVIFSELIPGYVPKRFRITLGIVLMLWGVYRFLVVRMKYRQYYDDDE